MNLDDRIRQQFPTLIITLLSVLVGLVFADLVSEARARMTLWPLNLGTLRTWAQIFAMGSSAFAAWVVYSHIGISRQRIPSFADSFIAFLAPVPLLIFNSFVGQKTIWPWFYFAGIYLAICLATSLWQLRLAGADGELKALRHLYRPTGFLLIFYIGVPAFLLFGWADQQKLLSPVLEVLIAFSPVPAAFLCTHLFLRDWRMAVAASSENKPSVPSRAAWSMIRFD
jgi:hypothetical protein